MAGVAAVAFVTVPYLLDAISAPVDPEIILFPLLPGAWLAAEYHYRVGVSLFDINGDLIAPAARMMIGGSVVFWFLVAQVRALLRRERNDRLRR